MTQLPETGFLRIRQVLNFIPIGRTTLWERVKAGTFPRPVKLGPKTTVWRVEDVRAFMVEAGK